MKNLDPYHVTIGAVNCADSWQFTDTAPSAVAAQPQPEAKVLPEGQQPALQLSLDVVMQENYLGDLPGGAQPGHYYSNQASPLLSQDGANTTLRQLIGGGSSVEDGLSGCGIPLNLRSRPQRAGASVPDEHHEWGADGCCSEGCKGRWGR